MIKARSRKHEAVTTPVKASTVKKVSKKPSIADEVSDTDYGFVTRRDLRPTKFPLVRPYAIQLIGAKLIRCLLQGVVSACSKIGRRQRQEVHSLVCYSRATNLRILSGSLRTLPAGIQQR